ncbi:MAG: type II toxin-antitoxin system RelE/ParE family toxin [Thermodesulfobacteriota bacterium]
MPLALHTIAHAKRDLKRVHSDNPLQAKRIVEAIRSLAEDPRPEGCTAVVGQGSLYRIRVGNFRVIYCLQEPLNALIIVAIRRRSEQTYKRIPLKSLAEEIAALKKLQPK